MPLNCPRQSRVAAAASLTVDGTSLLLRSQARKPAVYSMCRPSIAARSSCEAVGQRHCHPTWLMLTGPRSFVSHAPEALAWHPMKTGMPA